jgi:hypothetical protein
MSAKMWKSINSSTLVVAFFVGLSLLLYIAWQPAGYPGSKYTMDLATRCMRFAAMGYLFAVA